ncbi:MAG: ATP-binding protein [Lachnospiraceae bacterium]|nr:ATP-binding protein [Lachnospiraceae bacterium]
MRVREFILYRNFQRQDILDDFSALLEVENVTQEEAQVLREKLSDVSHRLLRLADDFGFAGNLWHCFLAYLLCNNENPFSCACEIRGHIEGSMNDFAMHDFGIFRELFSADMEGLGEMLGTDVINVLLCYAPYKENGKAFNKRIRDRICELAVKLAHAGSDDEFMEIVTGFYGDFGVGKFGLNKAFRVRHTEEGPVIEPIFNIRHVDLDDLVGYEKAKQQLIENTEAFIEGLPANNCLLYGDAGTGKSTSIKAIANRYYERGLRIIELYKHQFRDLNDVIAQIKNRNYKFILYMDDLSFEDFEVDYKYLKAVIEGGLEKKPENILIYATSNRRHLIRESFRDKQERDEDLHTNDTVQEKLSLSARFGMSIYFGRPDQKEYHEIVRALAQRSGIEMDERELLLEADRWELRGAGKSGRTAEQCIKNLSARLKK